MEKTCRSILVIEDDTDIRESVVEILRMEGYDVRFAENGQEAIELLPTLPAPTLLLLDMMMPIMNGWQFLEAQKANAKLADLKVVLVSAVPPDRALLNREGLAKVEGLLQKPLNVTGLLSVAEKYCLPQHALAEAVGE